MKGGNNIEIKLIGTNCSNGMKLKREVIRAIDGIDFPVSYIELNDEKTKKKYGIKNIPALVIKEDIKSEGSVLTSREITRLINAVVA